MKIGPTFRAYTPQDLPELETMVLALYADDPSGEPMTVEKVRRTAEELQRHPHKGTIVLFCIGQDVAGYAIVAEYWSNEYGGNVGIVDELYVKPQWRGQWIGSMFLDEAANLIDAPAVGLLLEVTPANERAKAYYLKQGFAPMRNRHLFKRLDRQHEGRRR